MYDSARDSRRAVPDSATGPECGVASRTEAARLPRALWRLTLDGSAALRRQPTVSERSAAERIEYYSCILDVHISALFL